MSRAMPSRSDLRARGFRQRPDAQVIGGDDLAGARALTGRDQLVARRQHGDARTAAHGQGCVTHGRGQGDLARAELPAGQQQRVARAEIGPCRTDVAAGPGRAGSDDDPRPRRA